jgi:hypothetical protein
MHYTRACSGDRNWIASYAPLISFLIRPHFLRLEKPGHQQARVGTRDADPINGILGGFSRLERICDHPRMKDIIRRPAMKIPASIPIRFKS